MKVAIETDRIRLTAETSDDNDAIRAIELLMWAARFPHEMIAEYDGPLNDLGCDSSGDEPLNYICMPSIDDIEAHGVTVAPLPSPYYDENNDESLEGLGPKTLQALLARRAKDSSAKAKSRRLRPSGDDGAVDDRF